LGIDRKSKSFEEDLLLVVDTPGTDLRHGFLRGRTDEGDRDEHEA
jgi:hypothetical protein